MIIWPITKAVPPPRLVCVELNPGPPKMTDSTRERIIGFLEAGGTPAEAARQYNVTISSVTRLQEKVKETGSVKNRPGQGRKRKLSESQADKVRKRAKRGKNSPQIAKEMSQELKEPVSVDTIRRTIKEGELEYLVVEEEEELTEAHKSKRLAYAQKNLEKDWNLVLFTDEKIFQLPAGVHKCWQDPKNRKRKKKQKRHTPKVMVWGGIGSYFKTPLVFVPRNTKLDSEGYLEILKNNLPPATTTKDCPKEKLDDWEFLQDGAAIHKAKKVLNYLEEHAPYFVRDHSPLSPDFNIIEDIWSQMNTELNKYKIKDLKSLKKHLRIVWKNISFEKVRASVNSMPKRLQECIDLNGERTQY
jgi:transposase